MQPAQLQIRVIIDIYVLLGVIDFVTKSIKNWKPVSPQKVTILKPTVPHVPEVLAED